MQLRPWLQSSQYHPGWHQQSVSLVQPRYATLPNIMKAKKKPMEQLTPEVGGPHAVAVVCRPCTGTTPSTMQALGVTLAEGYQSIQVEAPAVRKAGVKVESVAELLEKLKPVLASLRQ